MPLKEIAPSAFSAVVAALCLTVALWDASLGNWWWAGITGAVALVNAFMMGLNIEMHRNIRRLNELRDRTQALTQYRGTDSDTHWV